MVEGLSGAIIAAGRGERLRSASNGVPKPLVEIGGETLLARQARMIMMAGAAPVHVIVNSETYGIIRQCRLELPSVVELCVRDTPNSMESLLTLGERIAPGRFLLSTVDAVTDAAEFSRFSLRALELIDSERQGPLDGALGLLQWRGDSRPLFAEVAPNGVITALGQRECAMVTAGVYLFSTRIFAFAAKARDAGLDAMRRYLGLLIESGIRLAAVELNGVVDVDEAADLDAARAMVARQGGKP